MSHHFYPSTKFTISVCNPYPVFPLPWDLMRVFPQVVRGMGRAKTDTTTRVGRNGSCDSLLSVDG
jgi:hypothetical protein